MGTTNEGRVRVGREYSGSGAEGALEEVPRNVSGDVRSAKPDKSRQMARELTIEQRNAIDLLVTGQSDREVAEKVGVARQTVTGWRLHDLIFKAELNRVRKAIWGSSEDFLRSLLPKALRQIEKVLDTDNHDEGPRVAFEVLKACGLHSNAGHEFDNIGTEDPRQLAKEMADSRRREADSLKLSTKLGGASEEEINEIVKEMEREASAGGARK